METCAAMPWAPRSNPVFGNDFETCPACVGAVRINASIEDPEVIAKILAHLDAKATEPVAQRRSPCALQRVFPECLGIPTEN